MTTRILITGAGGAAAIALIQQLGKDFELYAADISTHAAGLYLVPPARRCIVERGASRGFVPGLLALCAKHRIDLVVPTVDCELEPVARSRAQFEAAGARVLVASAPTLRRCLDKLALMRLAASVVPVPRTACFDDAFDPTDWTFPLIVKPRSGSGGRGVVKLADAAALARTPRDATMLVQEFAPGLEYSVDVLATQLGRVVSAVPRLRLKVDSGVAVTACTVKDEELEELAVRVSSLIGLTGVANVQFRRDRTGRPVLLEINARFPGTMPLTVAAGVDMPGYAVRDILGLPLPPIDGFRELGMVRTWAEHFVPVGELDVPARDAVGAELAG